MIEKEKEKRRNNIILKEVKIVGDEKFRKEGEKEQNFSRTGQTWNATQRSVG